MLHTDPFHTSGVPGLADLVVLRDEYSLLVAFVQTVLRLDPDLLFGWDTELGALDYLAKRCSLHHIPLGASLARLSRKDFLFARSHCLAPDQVHFPQAGSGFFRAALQPLLRQPGPSFERSGARRPAKQSGIGRKVLGRVLLNLWRVADMEYRFTSYSLNNVYAQLFGIVKPVLPNSRLRALFFGGAGRQSVYGYVLDRLAMCERVADCLGLVARTIEMSKVYTIPFEAVLTRG